MGIPSSSPIDSSPSDSAAAASAIFFASSKYRTACYHHRQDTLAPGLRAERSHSSRIVRIAIYCATVLCLLVMYFPTPSKPVSIISSSNDGYSQLLTPRLLGCLPLSRRATLCCPCRLEWAAYHADCLPGIIPQAHPIGQANQGNKFTLDPYNTLSHICLKHHNYPEHDTFCLSIFLP